MCRFVLGNFITDDLPRYTTYHCHNVSVFTCFCIRFSVYEPIQFIKLKRIVKRLFTCPYFFQFFLSSYTHSLCSYRIFCLHHARLHRNSKFSLPVCAFPHHTHFFLAPACTSFCSVGTALFVSPNGSFRFSFGRFVLRIWDTSALRFFVLFSCYHYITFDATCPLLTPLDNAPAENFFGIFKTECFRRQKVDTLDQAKQLVHEYINFYNYERIQLKTMLTPFEKRRQLA